jgi:hypothetical protein
VGLETEAKGFDSADGVTIKSVAGELALEGCAALAAADPAVFSTPALF